MFWLARMYLNCKSSLLVEHDVVKHFFVAGYVCQCFILYCLLFCYDFISYMEIFQNIEFVSVTKIP